jgi:hypothetical protein
MSSLWSYEAVQSGLWLPTVAGILDLHLLDSDAVWSDRELLNIPENVVSPLSG